MRDGACGVCYVSKYDTLSWGLTSVGDFFRLGALLYGVQLVTDDVWVGRILILLL
jgi:hypothetical protein